MDHVSISASLLTLLRKIRRTLEKLATVLTQPCCLGLRKPHGQCAVGAEERDRCDRIRHRHPSLFEVTSDRELHCGERVFALAFELREDDGDGALGSELAYGRSRPFLHLVSLRVHRMKRIAGGADELGFARAFRLLAVPRVQCGEAEERQKKDGHKGRDELCADVHGRP